MMRPTTAVTLLSLSLLVPTAGCSLLAKTGATINGKPVSSGESSSPKSKAPAAAATAPSEAPAPSPLSAPPAPPAADVSDSVPAIPASMVVEAAAGAPVISLQGASWCDGVKGLDWGDGKAEREFKKHFNKAGELYSSGIDSMARVARFACGGKQSADRMTWVRNYMQASANVSGLSEQHQVHLMSVLAKADAREFFNYAPNGCEKFKPKGNPNALESNRNHALRIGMGCSDGSNAEWMLWWADRGEKAPSQIETLGFLYSSFAYSAKVVSFKTGATALVDANRFDQAAFFRELQELGADEEVVAKAIIQYGRTAKKLKAWKAHHAEALGEDYAVLTKAAQDGFDEWVASYKKEKAAVDFAFAMEEAVLEGDSRKFAGCSEKARKFATEFVMRGGPTTPDEIRSAAAHPIGSLLVAAAYECEKGLGNPLLASVYAQMGKSAPISRGPRFASRLALVKAVAEIKAVKSRFELEPRDFMPPSPREGFGRTSAGYFTTGEGVVKSAKKTGDTLEVTFKKESWKQPVYKCKETNRLDRIESDGTLVYRKSCKQTGTKTVTSQEKPVTIPAAAATGVKPGAFLVVARDKKKSDQGLPRHVYSSKDRKKLLNFYGLAL